MIIYQSTKKGFLGDAFSRDIEDIILQSYRERTGESISPREVQSWASSLMYMAKVLHHDAVPDDCGVAVEYTIPQTRKRVDFIISGKNEADGTSVVIVELTQWESVQKTDMGAGVIVRMGGAIRPKEHPSYQEWST